MSSDTTRVPASAPVSSSAPLASAPRSAMAVAGLVLGIVALATSFVPIVNNASFFIALLSAAFAAVGIVAAVRGTRTGRGMAIAALVVSAVAIAVVFATQSLYGAAVDAAVDDLSEGPAVTGVSPVASTGDASIGDAAAGAASGAASDAPGASSADLAVGSAVELEGGLSVSVDDVQAGLVNYDGSTVTGVRVTYTNGGDGEASFNMLDWKGQDAQGVQQYTTYYGDAEDALGSGTLAPGGIASGMLYFDGDLAKVLYYSSLLSSSATASWTVA